MKDKELPPFYLAGVAFLFYFLPILMITAFSFLWIPSKASWQFFSLGLFLSGIGTLTLFYLLILWKRQLSSGIAKEPEVADDHPEIVKLQEALQGEKEEKKNLQAAMEESRLKMQMLESEHQTIKRSAERIEEEFLHYKEKSHESLAEDKRLIEEYEEQIVHLRVSLEQKQLESDSFQNKIHDLTYEIKTLLQLADLGYDSHIQESGKAPTEKAETYLIEAPKEKEPVAAHAQKNVAEAPECQLKRCINIAQKVTSSHNFGGYNSRFRDLSLDNDALDLRRLCDNLRSERGNTIVVYSQKSKKILFVNDEVEKVTGWSVERFSQNFEEIIQEGIDEWRGAIAKLNTLSRTSARLIMKTASSHDLLFHFEAGLIPTGVFRHNVIAIFYPA